MLQMIASVLPQVAKAVCSQHVLLGLGHTSIQTLLV